MRDDWISQVFKGELGEKQQNFTETGRGIVKVLER